MSKTKELQLTLDKMIQCGEELIASANALKAIFTDAAEAEPAPAPAPTAEKKKPAKETATPKKEIRLTDIRAVLAEKSRAGFTKQVKELLGKYGADKLSAVNPKDYEALLSDAEVLGNG
ncbi:MAG: DNA ligase [Blautia sp.]|nr:DNA ligase [Blautia sp.]